MNDTLCLSLSMRSGILPTPEGYSPLPLPRGDLLLFPSAGGVEGWVHSGKPEIAIWNATASVPYKEISQPSREGL